MLEVAPPTELQELYQRGLAASTLVNQPFWKELDNFMNQLVLEALNEMEGAKWADDCLKARRVDRWLTIKDLVARIEQFPLAAIEAARELGESNVREGVQSSHSGD